MREEGVHPQETLQLVNKIHKWAKLCLYKTLITDHFWAWFDFNMFTHPTYSYPAARLHYTVDTHVYINPKLIKMANLWMFFLK